MNKGEWLNKSPFNCSTEKKFFKDNERLEHNIIRKEGGKKKDLENSEGEGEITAKASILILQSGKSASECL